MKMITNAVIFATTAHDGTYRKGTKIPYCAHPIEAGLIASTMTDDEEVIVATILHDVVEDTEYGKTDIQERFGERVAELVMHESEDKMRNIPAEASWKMRKQSTLDKLERASRDIKIICLADKLSNIRLSAKTHAEKGDAMWEDFNQKDPSQQEWYYRGIAEKLVELEEFEAYTEYVALCNEVFGRIDSKVSDNK